MAPWHMASPVAAVALVAFSWDVSSAMHHAPMGAAFFDDTEDPAPPDVAPPLRLQAAASELQLGATATAATTSALQMGREADSSSTGAELAKPCACADSTIMAVSCCTADIVQGRLESSIDAMQDYADKERAARREAASISQKASQEMLDLKDQEMAYKLDLAARNATYWANVKAKNNANLEYATIAAQAAQTARLKAAKDYASKETIRVAQEVAGAVRVQESDKANKAIDDAAIEAVRSVTKDTISVLAATKQANDDSATAAASKIAAADLREKTRRQGLYTKVAATTSETAAATAEDLEKKALESQAAALEAEKKADEDRKKLVEQTAALYTMIAQADAARDAAVKASADAAGDMSNVAAQALYEMTQVQKEGIKAVQEAAATAVSQAYQATMTPAGTATSGLAQKPCAPDISPSLTPSSALSLLQKGKLPPCRDTAPIKM